MLVRPPAVAGSFYPAERGELRGMVMKLLADAHSTQAYVDPPAAIIVPHAGYIYSGSTAALGYSHVSGFSHVVIYGPTHRVGIHGIALPGADAFATPLGKVPLWAEGVAAAESLEKVEIAPQVHEHEHSLEVQLPFIQQVLPDADILPLAVGWVEPGVVAEVIAALAGPDVLTVISSDLSHYLSYDDARDLDRSTITQILQLDPSLDHEQACGATPVNGMLLAAEELGLAPVLYGANNSGDTAGDKRRVVGYSSFGFYPPENAYK
ncbi:MAG: AmmeMemoRadiSam system protein B [Propionibacteriaceae bacterium]|nr:AmmeMemoRadiSam system protein B [Propionibacteriaceae bacterium]